MAGESSQAQAADSEELPTATVSPEASPPSAAGSEGTTGAAPPFRPPLPALPAAEPPHLRALPQPGEQLGDFELVRLLGFGSFAKVFLARQRSLDRLVALKVSTNSGTEALTLAQLEHDHIVRIFSETVDSERNLRLLCMQYVPGTTLERLLTVLTEQHGNTWSGREFLQVLDALSQQAAPLEPAALRDRELLASCDRVEVTCWLGARLAEALAHAHACGVLHCDIKPANILLNGYGRPFLADFNVALARRQTDLTEQRLGGTLAYMAPEHLEAFHPRGNTPPEAVDHRADIYSLGIVIFRLLTGRLPFPPLPQHGDLANHLQQLAAARRAGAPPPSRWSQTPAVVERVVCRCLAPQPEERYPSAAELAQALEGCRELRRRERTLPPAGPISRALLRRPFLMGFLLGLLPHLLGSLVNIAYNAVHLVSHLQTEQQVLFQRLVLGYNLLAYPGCVAVLCWLLLPLVRGWRRLSQPAPVTDAEVTRLRQRTLSLPGWCATLSCLGWLPGGLLFPLALEGLSGPLPPGVFVHFLISFTISGLIALTYSVLAVQYLVLRICYPRMWADGQGVRRLAPQELRGLDWRLSGLQFLAVLIPLAGAILMVGVGPGQFREANGQFNASRYEVFRLLVTALLALGMLGLGIALLVCRRLQETLTVLTGGQTSQERPPPAPPQPPP